jgi:putative SOS response-associated peptidase YedK
MSGEQITLVDIIQKNVWQHDAHLLVTEFLSIYPAQAYQYDLDQLARVIGRLRQRHHQPRAVLWFALFVGIGSDVNVETAATKPYFRKAWKSGRCLIPADGWYEWKVTDKVKQPYFIHREDDQPMLMAGLYETNPHANITSFAILTTDADGNLSEVHDRKPVVLSGSAANQWIIRELPADEIAAIAQSPLTAEWFAWHTVSTKVNNMRNDGAELCSAVAQ